MDDPVPDFVLHKVASKTCALPKRTMRGDIVTETLHYDTYNDAVAGGCWVVIDCLVFQLILEEIEAGRLKDPLPG